MVAHLLKFYIAVLLQTTVEEKLGDSDPRCHLLLAATAVLFTAATKYSWHFQSLTSHGFLHCFQKIKSFSQLQMHVFLSLCSSSSNSSHLGYLHLSLSPLPLIQVAKTEITNLFLFLETPSLSLVSLFFCIPWYITSICLYFHSINSISCQLLFCWSLIPACWGQFESRFNHPCHFLSGINQNSHYFKAYLKYHLPWNSFKPLTINIILLSDLIIYFNSPFHSLTYNSSPFFYGYMFQDPQETEDSTKLYTYIPIDAYIYTYIHDEVKFIN